MADSKGPPGDGVPKPPIFCSADFFVATGWIVLKFEGYDKYGYEVLQEGFIIIPRRSRRDIVLAASVHSVRPSAIFVCLEPYLSTYWSDLIHFWYK